MTSDPKEMPGLDNVNTCTGQIEVPTPREREALAVMKSTKERVREIKKRLSELKTLKEDAPAEKILTLEGELVFLKQEWDVWEAKREAAARARMVLLGHETED